MLPLYCPGWGLTGSRLAHHERDTVKFRTAAASGVLAAATVLALAACAGGGTSGAEPSASASASPTTAAVDYSKLAGTITAGGSSAQANAQAAWTAALTAQAPGVTVNYDKSQGSGGGVTNFLGGTYDFAGSDSPLNADQTAQAASGTCGPDGAVNLPVYLDGVAIVYNLPGVTKLNLSGSTLAKIFNLQITDWSDPAITADNGGKEVATGPIQTVARSDGSGTTATFANYLTQVNKADWPYEASNKWPVTGNVSAQQGGSGVVNTVKAGTGTIGYADHSAIGDLTAASVGVSAKDFVAFSADAVTAAFTAGATAAGNGVEGDLSQKIDYTKLTSADTYPIPLVSYDIICKTFKNPAQTEVTTGYLSFIASETGQKIAAKNAGSAPLPQDILDQINDTLAMVK
jgi:phosphate transport system substrate-binding protein